MAPSPGRTLSALLVSATILAGCAIPFGTPSGPAPPSSPDLARSLMGAASQALAQGDPATAATYFRGVHVREPDNIPAALGLMQSLRLIGGLDEAREVAAKTLAAKPDDPDVLAAAGKVTLAIGHTQEATRLLERAASANPRDWRAQSALGLAYDRLGDAARAGRSYQAALQISPENTTVLNNFALSRAMAGDLDGARALAQRAAAAAGADLRVKQNLALIYALSGNMTKAEELTRRDLPPPAARATIEYYRELATTSAPQQP